MQSFFEVRADLSPDLRFGEQVVRVQADRLEVVQGSSTVLSLPLSSLSKVYVEDGIGIDKLVVVTKDGEEREVAYFTKARTWEFRRLARAVEEYLRGGTPPPQQGQWGREEKGKVSTLLWLIRFMSPYRGKIVLGIGLSVALTALNLIPPYLLKILIDSVLLSPSHSTSLFLKLTEVLLSSYAAVAVVSGFQRYILNNTGQKIVNDMRTRIFDHVLKHSSSFVDRYSTGRILSRLTNDVGNTQWLMVWGLSTLIVNVLTLVGIGVILFTMDVSLAVYILIPLPLVVYLLVEYRRRTHKLYHRNWRRNAEVIAKYSDVIPNYMVVKSFTKEEEEVQEFSALANSLYESQREVSKVNAFYWPTIGFLTSLSSVVIWWIGGNQVLAGRIELGVVTAFVSYLSQFYGPINNLSNIVPFVQQAITSGERIREVLESKPDIDQPPTPKRPSLREDIVFENVKFGYDPFLPVLKGVNVRIRGGERVVLVGRSGSGKTTLSKLIMRLYDVNEGRITIGGVDVREIDLPYLRERIAYVPQEHVLFESSVYRNIAYGAPGPVSPLDVIGAAIAARVHEDIMKFPLAYDTNVGERGSFLSGGQRQRIAIARAFLKDPDVVIFDEATSNLDVMNEREVYRAILNLSSGRTTILITHNIREVMGADRVIVMRDGEVVEEGKPGELLERGGEFASMFKGYEVDALDWEKGAARVRDYASKYLLNPREVRVRQSSRRSRVDVTYGGKRWEALLPRLPFPLSDPNFVILEDRTGQIVGIIEDLKSLDEESARALRGSIELSRMVVGIGRILKVRVRGEETEMEVITERGDRIKVTARGRRSFMRFGDEVVITDVNGNLYGFKLKGAEKRSVKQISGVY